MYIPSFLKPYKTIVDWYRAGRPVPPPHEIKERIVLKYLRAYHLKTFIESGTYLGDMVERVKNMFAEVISIELDPVLCKKAQARFAAEKQIKIYEGDSGKILTEMLRNRTVPALFWLDGHYSAGVTAKGELETPIWAELRAVFEHPLANHVILIDDARLFVGEHDYPTLQELKNFVIKAGRGYIMSVKDDIIRIVPQQ